MLYDVDSIRKDFPILSRQVYGRPLVYLDNGATTQKPIQVLDAMRDEYLNVNANVHRGVHYLSQQATELHEAARETVRCFIGARSTTEIVFTRGTTEGINLVAASFGQAFMKAGDEVIVSVMEHHSNIVPWQLLAERTGIRLRVIPMSDRGELDMEAYAQLFSERTRLVCVTHVSNVLGTVNPVKRIIQLAHAHDVPVLVDGAQSTPHIAIDVQDMDCDFFVFSGHKTYGPTGVGVLYGKEKWLEQMPPYMGGGEMIETVRFEKTTFAPLPLKFEAGTPNFVAGACFAPALETARQLAEDPQLQDNQCAMRDFLLEELPRIPGLRIYGLPRDRQRKIPLFSFTLDGAFPADLAQILDKMGIAVRSGHMCAEPLLRRFGQTSMLRASLAPYNTLAECETFLAALRRAAAMLR